MNDDETPYEVTNEDQSFIIRDRAGTSVLRCSDETSAHHYAQLLTQAYRSGYKNGYRDGREKKSES